MRQQSLKRFVFKAFINMDKKSPHRERRTAAFADVRCTAIARLENSCAGPRRFRVAQVDLRRICARISTMTRGSRAHMRVTRQAIAAIDDAVGDA